MNIVLISINEYIHYKQKILLQMYHFNHNQFQLPQVFDDFKLGGFDLPTTTHNSPGSMKSKSLTFQDSPFNCSFDEGSQSNHSQAVWNASIKYLQSALKQFVNVASGLNDNSLYCLMTDQNLSNQNLEEIIFKNTNLKIQQKHEFIGDLHNETQLTDLLKELSKLFNESIFHEITYVIYKIWEKKNQNQKHKSKIVSEDEPLIPHFDCFWGYQEEQVPKISYAPSFFEEKNMNDIVEDADRCAQEIAEEIYFDKKLKLVNLRECKKQAHQEFTVASVFSQFFKTITRSVFLSSEGYYSHPSTGEEINDNNFCQQFSNADFQFEMNDICALDQLEFSRKRFARSFSQDLSDEEEDFEACQGPSKKRKLQ